MSQIEIAVLASKKIEALLRDGFGAQGRGLHEYLANIEHRLPAAVVKKGRYIASLRNQVVHHDGVITDIADFNQVVEDVVEALSQQLAQEKIAKENEERLKREQDMASGEAHVEHPVELQLALKQLKSQNNLMGYIVLASLCLCVYFFIKANIDNSNTPQISQLNSQIVGLERKLRYEKDKTAKLEAQLKQLAKTAATKEPQVKSVAKSSSESIPAGNTANAQPHKTAKSESTQRVQNKAEIPATTEPSVTEDNSLLAQARSASSEYDKAAEDITVNFVTFVRSKTQVTLGQPDVSQNADGTYNVRVPVSWTLPEQELLLRLNRYFNDRDRSRLAMSSGRLIISKNYAESATAIKPYSGRLFKELQKIELSIQVSVGNKKGNIIIAGNASCFVSCSYSTGASDSWIIQTRGEPGLRNLKYNQESPIVIEGLTEQDLKTAAKPTFIISENKA